ncbi:leucine-rich repeat domain-containing protein [Halosquirtibacter xylanolyticus]|uniref:leucine-rich repeat domain-containing protein n=1 Tax=Halosquirtibacter xylanolyticus TaxID=3374599 RepID=UPI0037480B08|nr:leucine-rich repeat domain-containing protein [Prolixibacteraceae bacterium]
MKQLFLFIALFLSLQSKSQDLLNLPASQSLWDISEVTIDGVKGISLNRYLGDASVNGLKITIPSSIGSKSVIALCYIKPEDESKWIPLIGNVKGLHGLFNQYFDAPNRTLVEVNAENTPLLYVGPLALAHCVHEDISITLPHSMKYIRFNAFERAGFKEFIFPISLVYLGKNAFTSSSLKQTTSLPIAVTNIFAETFSSSIEGDIEKYVHSKVSYIGPFAFSDCDKLTGHLSLSDEMNVIEEFAFSSCSSIEQGTDMPSNLTIIKRNAFANSSAYKKDLVFSEGLVEIQENAFGEHPFMGFIYNGKQIESITLPKSITTIGVDAFKRSTSTTKFIRVLSSTPPTVGNKRAFDAAAYENTQLLVPVGALNNYKSAAIWKEFKSISEDDGTIKLSSNSKKRDEVYNITNYGRIINFKQPFNVKSVLLYDIKGTMLSKLNHIDSQWELPLSIHGVVMMTVEMVDGSILKEKIMLK